MSRFKVAKCQVILTKRQQLMHCHECFIREFDFIYNIAVSSRWDIVHVGFDIVAHFVPHVEAKVRLKRTMLYKIEW